MKIAVIIPAAGLGKRFNAANAGKSGPGSKVELNLAGRPVFQRAIELFLNRPVVEQIILAVNPDTVDEFKFRWGEKMAFLGVRIVPGGKAERWETVLQALEAVRDNCTHVAIHDAARPMTSATVIDRIFETAEKHPAVIPGIPASATLKKVASLRSADDARDAVAALLGTPAKIGASLQRVVATVDRSELVEIQTPQVFEIGLIRRAYAQITSGKIAGQGITDDAGLVESLGEPVVVVESESTNIKITRPEDLELAAAYLQVKEQAQTATLAKKRLFAEEED